MSLFMLVGFVIHLCAGFALGFWVARATEGGDEGTIRPGEALPVARIQPGEAIINGKRVTLPLAQLDAVYDAETGTITYRVNELPKDGAA